jgi:hypothetical protein
MADAQEMIGGPARDWLAANRQSLNGRFATARRRFPQLDGQALLPLCRELLPPMAGEGERGTSDLLFAVYDLILLHAGRGTVSPSGGSLPGIGVLLRVTFPKLRRLLLERPRELAPALSNAVENLGDGGVEFARTLATMAHLLPSASALRDAGAVVAWRLGEARLRAPVLAIFAKLPPQIGLAALGLGAYPEEAAPLFHAGLAADGWSRPEKLLSEQTLAGLKTLSPDRRGALAQQIASRPAPELSGWSLVGRLGNFLGFGGHFDQPPLLLDAGGQMNRHRFWVQSGMSNYRIDADVFGWVCRPDPSTDYRVHKLYRKNDLSRTIRPLLPTAATSMIAVDDAWAFTLADSFRVRILTPSRKPQ